MSAPFDAHEQEKIRADLRAAAMRHAQLEGMKRTTVDQLTAEVGISKGAFYHFYASKELLFLDMLEGWYQNITLLAARAYDENRTLPPQERGALMFRTAIGHMLSHPLSRFIRDDVPVLLRRIPTDVLSAHYTSDDDFILSLIRRSQIRLLVGEDVAAAIIKLLMLSIVHSDKIGPCYPQALEATIRSVCVQLIAE